MNTFKAFLHQISSWQALLDILLIAFGLFYLYRTIYKLGTWKILVGIVLAFLFFVIASVLNLEGIEWIFKNISHVTVIGMIIIFQPELRKFFEKLVSVHGQNDGYHDNEATDMVADSLWKMAEQRCGALIVFPGTEALSDKLSGGFTLNAEMSTPLILSIFDHHSPGHDGALIVERGKLTRFGVRLPISVSDRLGNEYGTRHHAGMGLAEQSDALILVVSEERGHVSAFAGGQMKRLLTRQQIVDQINLHSQKHGQITLQGGRRIKLRTILQAAACLVIASFFWSSLVVVNAEIIERVITIPVEYTSPGAGLVLVGEKTDKVKAHITGSKANIDNIDASNTVVKVDLSKMAAGKRSVLISSENLHLPKDITLLDSEPANLSVTLAGMVEKSAPVVPQLIGKLPEGKKVKSIRVEPAMVQILAPPEKNGYKTPELSTTPVYLNSIESASTLLCKIVAAPSLQPADKKWPDVKVVIELAQ